MLTLYQRLILGCLLLIALVTGVSLLVRTSFVQLAALDASQHTADSALAALAAVRASLAGEELTAARLDIGATSQLSSQFAAQAAQTQALLDSASTALKSFAPDVSLDDLKTRHTKIAEQARKVESADRLAPQLERLDRKSTRLNSSHVAIS